MKFGVREITDVVFKAKKDGWLGNSSYGVGQPVLYIDSAKTSTLEGASTTVYAQGGKGNSRLIAWEGEKTLTFTVEDALLSTKGMAILTGAGLISKKKEKDITYVHHYENKVLKLRTSGFSLDAICMGTISGFPDTTEATLRSIFVMYQDLTGNLQIFDKDHAFDYVGSEGGHATAAKNALARGSSSTTVSDWPKAIQEYIQAGRNEIPVIVDYYTAEKVNCEELTIDAGNFAGNWYVEAETKFRRQSDGKDLRAILTLPNVKIQSNFTFAMAATGDPSTFTFTMDALPGYTMFDSTKKVLCTMQVIDDDIVTTKDEENTIFNDSIGDVIKKEGDSVKVEYTIYDDATLDDTYGNPQGSIVYHGYETVDGQSRPVLKNIYLNHKEAEDGTPIEVATYDYAYYVGTKIHNDIVYDAWRVYCENEQELIEKTFFRCWLTDRIVYPNGVKPESSEE